MADDEDLGFGIATVNVEDKPDLQQKYKFPGFPTVIYFINSYPIEYSGGKSGDAIFEWIESKVDF
jgi:thioredoxin-like negative regulator of GroEL